MTEHDVGCLSASVPRVRIFPLHLSPIESFMLADDQPGYPMTFVIRLQVAGQIERRAFAAALRQALARHPLLRALITAGKSGLPCWMPVEEPCPALDWNDEAVPVVCAAGESIDLAAEIGLRVWIRQGAERATVTLQFHHACTDGTGAYRFIGDLLAGYAMQSVTAGRPAELGPLDASLLRGRRDRALSLPPGTSGSQRTLLALRQGWKILRRQPAPLAPPAGRRGREAAFPGFLCRGFDRAECERLRGAAAAAGVTLNDLLLRDLFVVLDQWQGERLAWFRPRRLRIMMPTDLRSADDFEMPAANMVAYTFLASRVGEVRRPSALLQTIRAQTALIKHHQSGKCFMDMIYGASRIRGLLPFVLRRPLCMATAILSNVADPSRRFTARLPRQDGRIVAGNLVLEEITGVPPLRPKTRATFSISQYDRRLTISLRCDPQHFRLEDTAALLDLYVAQLRRTIDR